MPSAITPQAAKMRLIEIVRRRSYGTGVEIKLAEDGELLVRSPALASSYFQDPTATAEVFQNGWLHTGDLAEISPDGYASITGRKKEMIVSSNGKKIYPIKLEALFKTEPIVSQMLLVGDNEQYVSALFTINAAAAEAIPGMKGTPRSLAICDSAAWLAVES